MYYTILAPCGASLYPLQHHLLSPVSDERVFGGVYYYHVHVARSIMAHQQARAISKLLLLVAFAVFVLCTQAIPEADNARRRTSEVSTSSGQSSSNEITSDALHGWWRFRRSAYRRNYRWSDCTTWRRWRDLQDQVRQGRQKDICRASIALRSFTLESYECEGKSTHTFQGDQEVGQSSNNIKP